MARKRKAQNEQKPTLASSSKRKKDDGEGSDEPESRSQLQSQSQPREPNFEAYPPAKVYRLVEPGPVLLVTTGSLADSTHNVMTIGFHMVMQHESPPLLGILLGPWDASFAALKKQRECVLAVPSVEMAGVVVDVGNCSAADDDDADDAGGGEGEETAAKSKWDWFGLEALPATKVKAPLVGGPDVIANIECVVEDTKMVSKYSMWVLKPVKAWLNPRKKPGEGGKMFHHRGDGTFVVDGEILDLKDRMVK
ncbi:hypothetical protein SLS62_006948 [Diatrype stigma]|uniref:Flavin reductase like domain-containing protein n=1 Tax=Diatrype stigma TaxID=117547 RepID=A0AAN9UM04_9PEZI